MPDPLSAAPAAVTAALERLKEELPRAAGANFSGLILYGGLARGRFRPGQSDVNVVVLLHEVSTAALAAVAPALKYEIEVRYNNGDLVRGIFQEEAEAIRFLQMFA